MHFPEESYYKRIEEITLLYETDADLRFNILKFVLSYGAEVDEVAAKEADGMPLNDFRTGIWAREEVIGYLTLLQVWLGFIRGTIQPDDPIGSAVKIEYLRAMWLSNNDFRDLVEELQSALGNAAGLFNVQMVHSWLPKIARRIGYNDPPEHRLFQGFNWDVVKDNYSAVDNHLHNRAAGYVRSHVAPLFDRLRKEAPSWAGAIVLTAKEVKLLALQRRGGRVDPADFAPEPPAAVEQESKEIETEVGDIAEALDLFEKSPGGVFIPKK